MHELKFGTFVPQGWRLDLADTGGAVEKYEAMSRCALEAEKAGYDALWLYDHFRTVPESSVEATFECWSSMAALARDTSSIKLGQMVTCNAYRPPSLLAKMSSCIDVLSHGRLIVGIGAGWYEQEFRAYGYPFPDTPERLRMLREAIQVLKAMWIEERAQYEGRYYQVRGAINEPKPVQRPHPPLWIGGSGEKVTLKLVAQHGDGCNVGGDLETVRQKLNVLRRHCENAGRDYESIVKSYTVEAIVGRDGAEIDGIVTDVARRTAEDPQAVRDEYRAFTGRPEQVAAAIQEVVEAGVDYIIVYQPNMAEGGVIQRFAEEVIPLIHAKPPVR